MTDTDNTADAVPWLHGSQRRLMSNSVRLIFDRLKLDAFLSFGGNLSHAQ